MSTAGPSDTADVTARKKWRPKPTQILTLKTTLQMGKGMYARHNWVRLCREKDGRDPDASTSDDDAGDGHAGLNLAEREFLRKVSAKYGSKKKARHAMGPMEEWRMAFRTEGYDKEDPFIDDTIPADDIVPSSLDTPYGGFYISRGPMVARVVRNSPSPSEDDSDSSVDQPVRLKQRKKTEPITAAVAAASSIKKRVDDDVEVVSDSENLSELRKKLVAAKKPPASAPSMPNKSNTTPTCSAPVTKKSKSTNEETVAKIINTIASETNASSSSQTTSVHKTPKNTAQKLVDKARRQQQQQTTIVQPTAPATKKVLPPAKATAAALGTQQTLEMQLAAQMLQHFASPAAFAQQLQTQQMTAQTNAEMYLLDMLAQQLQTASEPTKSPVKPAVNTSSQRAAQQAIHTAMQNRIAPAHAKSISLPVASTSVVNSSSSEGLMQQRRMVGLPPSKRAKPTMPTARAKVASTGAPPGVPAHTSTTTTVTTATTTVKPAPPPAHTSNTSVSLTHPTGPAHTATNTLTAASKLNERLRTLLTMFESRLKHENTHKISAPGAWSAPVLDDCRRIVRECSNRTEEQRVTKHLARLLAVPIDELTQRLRMKNVQPPVSKTVGGDAPTAAVKSSNAVVPQPTAPAHTPIEPLAQTVSPATAASHTTAQARPVTATPPTIVLKRPANFIEMEAQLDRLEMNDNVRSLFYSVGLRSLLKDNLAALIGRKRATMMDHVNTLRRRDRDVSADRPAAKPQLTTLEHGVGGVIKDGVRVQQQQQCEQPTVFMHTPGVRPAPKIAANNGLHPDLVPTWLLDNAPQPSSLVASTGAAWPTPQVNPPITFPMYTTYNNPQNGKR